MQYHDSSTLQFGPMIERECTSKRRFSDEDEADQEVAIIFNEGGPILNHYRCPWCFGVHLTRRNI